MADNMLEYINFKTMVDHYDEMLVSNYWTLNFEKFPAAAYNPGNDFLKTRVQSVTGFVEPEASLLEFTVRGYPSYQPGSTSVPVADLVHTFVDYEDSTIMFFGRNWRDVTHYWARYIANRLEYVAAAAKYYRCNKAGQPVREYEGTRMVFQNLQYQDDFTETSDLIGYNCAIGTKCLLKQKMNNYSGV